MFVHSHGLGSSCTEVSTEESAKIPQIPTLRCKRSWPGRLGSDTAPPTYPSPLVPIKQAISQAGIDQALNAACVDMLTEPSSSTSGSGTSAHPIDVCTPLDVALWSPSVSSPAIQIHDQCWAGHIVCAPATSLDDDSGQIFSEIPDFYATDTLVLPNSGRLEMPMASIDFQLPQPRRGPVGSIAVYQDYLNRAQRLMQDLKARDDSATTHVSAVIAYIKQILLDDAHFVVGNWHHYANLWASHLQSIPRWLQHATVLEWIRQGYPIDWVAPESEIQKTHPRFKIKKREVTTMLQ